jgi:hypothetical protein
VVSDPGVVITGVTGPDIKVQAGDPDPTLPPTVPTSVVADPQTMALPPALAVQFTPCAFTVPTWIWLIANKTANACKQVFILFAVFNIDGNCVFIADDIQLKMVEIFTCCNACSSYRCASFNMAQLIFSTLLLEKNA